MVKMRFIIALLLIIVLANCQDDKKFKVRVTFEKGLTTSDVTFSDGTKMTTASTGVGSVSWESILNKPSFATVATTGSYNDLKDKPAEVNLAEAIPTLPGIRIPVMTTTQINGLTGVVSGTLVYDGTLNVLKIYVSGTWKTIITDR